MTEKIEFLVIAKDMATKVLDRVNNSISKLSENMDKKLSKALSNLKWDFLGLGFFLRQFGMEARNLFNETDNVLGISRKMAQLVGGGLVQAMDEVTIKTMEFATTLLFYAEPSITKNVNSLIELMETFNKLPEPIKEAIGGLIGFTVVWGPILSLIAFFALGMTTVIGLLEKMGVISMATAGAIKGAFGWIILIALELWQIFDMIFNKKAPEDLNIFQKAIATMGGVVVMVFGTIIGTLATVGFAIAEFVANGLSWFAQFSAGVYNTIGDLMGWLSGLPFVGGLFGGLEGAARAAAGVATGIGESMRRSAEEMSEMKRAAFAGVTSGIDQFHVGMDRLWGTQATGQSGAVTNHFYISETELGATLAKMGYASS